eukprot:Opistho-1_new@11065
MGVKRTGTKATYKLIWILVAILILFVIVAILAFLAYRKRKSDEKERTESKYRISARERYLNMFADVKTAFVAYVFSVYFLDTIAFCGLVMINNVQPTWSSLNGDIVVTLFQTIWGISPILASFVAHVFGRRLLKDFTALINLSTPIILLIGYFIPILCGTLQYGLAVATKTTKAYNATFVHEVGKTFGYSTHAMIDTPGKPAAAGLFYEYFIGPWWDLWPPPSCNWGNGEGWSGGSWVILAIFEETGWMGVLFPTLLVLLNRRIYRAMLLTGVMWAMWHWPYIILGYFNEIPAGTGYFPGNDDTPLYYSLPMFTLTLMALRIVIIEVTLRTYSLVPAVLIHAVHNSVIMSYLSQLPFFKTYGAAFMVGESGVFLCTFYWISALTFLTIR